MPIHLTSADMRHGEAPRLSIALPKAILGVVVCVMSLSCRGNYSTMSEGSGTSTGASSGSNTGSGGDDGIDTTEPYDFVALQPSAYTNKVKTLLTGLAATQEEVVAVVANDAALGDLLDTWMKTDAYKAIMQNFFTMMLQQSLATAYEYTQTNINYSPGTLLQRNMRDSMALTVQQFVEEASSFTQIASTRQFMMTTAMMTYYAFLDTQLRSDTNAIGDTVFNGSNANNRFSLQLTGAAIPMSSSVNPADPNFLVFNFPPLLSLESNNPNCPNQDPFVLNPASCYQGRVGNTLMNLLQGYGFIYQMPAPAPRCYARNFTSTFLTAADYADWHMVTIRQPQAGEATAAYYNLAKLRGATTLVLNTPRVGFFTTPAFLAQWNTNPSNQARVTMNQTLIVALGHDFNGADTVSIPATAALDNEHASDPACFACHQNLDPMRQFFRHDYTIYFSPQTDSNQKAIPPTFAFDGVINSGGTIYDLGESLASHPRFATAWTQKLCSWANSAPCSETDPEFIRVAQVFAQSNYLWSTLVKTLMTSPIVTYKENTPTAVQTQEITSLARREHLCAMLDARLGLLDFCGLASSLGGQTSSVLTSALPSNLYSRGQIGSVLVTSPDLMFRTEIENLCAQASTKVVDAGTTSLLSSTDINVSINTLVAQVMGLAGDDAAQVNSILSGHYADAVAAGAKPKQALQSTFIAACLSPQVMAIGF